MEELQEALEQETKGIVALLAAGVDMPFSRTLQQWPVQLKALNPRRLLPGEELGLAGLAEVGPVVGVQEVVAKTPKPTHAVSVSS